MNLLGLEIKNLKETTNKSHKIILINKLKSKLLVVNTNCILSRYLCQSQHKKRHLFSLNSNKSKRYKTLFLISLGDLLFKTFESES